MKQLLLDEHVPGLFRVQLQRREPGLSVRQVGHAGAPPRGTPDPDLLVWCERNDFVLVTNNRKRIPVHLADHVASGGRVPGILTVNLSASIGLVLEDLELLAVAAGEDELRDQITFVPLQ